MLDAADETPVAIFPLIGTFIPRGGWLRANDGSSRSTEADVDPSVDPNRTSLTNGIKIWDDSSSELRSL